MPARLLHTGPLEEQALSTEDLLQRLAARFGSEAAARAWFETEPLRGLSGQTAQQLVSAGRACDALGFLAAVDAGVYSEFTLDGLFWPSADGPLMSCVDGSRVASGDLMF